jgi:N-acetylneuraminate synthase
MEAVSPDTCQPALNEKTEGIRYLMDKYAIQAGDAIYLGDSPDDLAAAQASGLAFIGLEYGYGTFPTSAKSYSTVKSFSELPMNLLPALDRLQDKGEHMINRDIFEELFILELANNHWGNIERGLKIIKEFGTVVRYNDVRAGIKLQLRDVDTFIHKDFLNRDDIRYIKKTLDTRLSREDFAQLVEAIRRNNCVRVATPFDEKSVEYCVELGIEIIKVGSSDVTDWPLLEKIARTRKPVLVSTGGTSLKDIDDMVTFFDNRNIPLAINHCISIYPSEDADLQLNQIDFLRNRYPGHVIGFSTHEYHDWRSSIMIAYAKGARTFERHIDIQSDDRPLSPYCSTPEQIAEWFQAFKKAREICGAPGTEKAPSTQKEIDYLTSLVRGVYASSDLPAGHVLTPDDYYLAIPLQKGQLSCRELLNDQVLAREVKKDAPLMVDSVDSLYNRDDVLRKQLYARGL